MSWPRPRLSALILTTLLLLPFYFIFTSEALASFRGQIIPKLSTNTTEEQHSQPSNNTDTPHPQNDGRVLLVSAYFPLTNSKHSLVEYGQWISHYLGMVTTDIYFYTTPEHEFFIREARGSLPITINTTYSSPWDIPPFQAPGIRERYAEMWHQDREKKRHTPELYAIWNGKQFLLLQALQNLGMDRYEYAFWNDAGSYRTDDVYDSWPDASRVEEVFTDASSKVEYAKDEMIFYQVAGLPDIKFRQWEESQGPIDQDISEGSFFGGSPRAISWYHDAFYAYHDHWLSQSIFVGKDQTMINGLFMLFPARFVTVWYHDDDLRSADALNPEAQNQLAGRGICASEWYYYHFWLSNSQAQDRLRRVWDEQKSHSIWWRIKQWFSSTPIHSCQVAPTRTVAELFHKAFGNGWLHPIPSLPPISSQEN